MSGDPHGGARVHTYGAPLNEAEGAVILLHGRGGTAEDILMLGSTMYLPKLAYLAPQAAGNAWYPYSFLAPREENEPWLTSALRTVERTVQSARDAGIPLERIVLSGFSQGACLATEFVASYPHRYAGLIAFTGGLVGPLGTDLTHAGDLAGMPAFMGSGDPDPHVPWTRVQESAEVLRRMGADVTTRRYPGRPHTIGGEEMGFGKRLIEDAFRGLAPLRG